MLRTCNYLVAGNNCGADELGDASVFRRIVVEDSTNVGIVVDDINVGGGGVVGFTTVVDVDSIVEEVVSSRMELVVGFDVGIVLVDVSSKLEVVVDSSKVVDVVSSGSVVSTKVISTEVVSGIVVVSSPIQAPR